MKTSQSRLQHLCFALVMSLLLAAALPAHAQLDILLTNEDGFGEPGIEALKTRLRDAGYTVSVGAPDGNANTSATSLDLIRPFWQVDCPEVDECQVRSVCIEGFTPPASCTTLEDLGPATPVASILATGAFLGKDLADFDLIVSGIDGADFFTGPNLGPELQFSGTVGAAIAAISKLVADTPAIAVSTVSDPVNVRLDDVADFVVTLVAHLEDAKRRPTDKLLPDGIGLNINYPDLAPEDVAGVKLTVQDRVLRGPATGEIIVLRAVPFPPLEDANVFILDRTTIPSDDKERRRADTTAFEKGFITITPVAADYTAGIKAQRRVKKLMKGLVRGDHRPHRDDDDDDD